VSLTLGYLPVQTDGNIQFTLYPHAGACLLGNISNNSSGDIVKVKERRKKNLSAIMKCQGARRGIRPSCWLPSTMQPKPKEINTYTSNVALPDRKHDQH